MGKAIGVGPATFGGESLIVRSGGGGVSVLSVRSV